MLLLDFELTALSHILPLLDLLRLPLLNLVPQLLEIGRFLLLLVPGHFITLVEKVFVGDSSRALLPAPTALVLARGEGGICRFNFLLGGERLVLHQQSSYYISPSLLCLYDEKL